MGVIGKKVLKLIPGFVRLPNYVINFSLGSKGGDLPLTVVKKPSKSSVTLSGTTIKTKGLKFSGQEIELDDKGAQVVAELADLLLRSPEIRRIRIEGSGDETLSLSRGLLIKQRLSDAGVEDERVDAQGGGGRSIKITVLP